VEGAIAWLTNALASLGPGNVIGLIGVTVGVFTAIKGFVEYERAQQWKRGEFLAGEMKEFHANKAIRNALSILDWADRKVELFPDHPNPAERYVLVDDQLLESALTPGKASYADDEAAIRDVIIEFLDALERFEEFVASNLITTKQLRPYLHYWIETLADAEKAGDRTDRVTAILTFIKVHEYTGVLELIRRYGYDDSLRGRIARVGARIRERFTGAKPLAAAK